MTDNAALYIDDPKPIPIAFVQRNAPFARVAPHQDGSPGFFITGQGWHMAIHVMPQEQIAQHLVGFNGYVAHVTGGGATPAAQSVLQRLQRVKLVLGCVVEPGFDPGGHARRTLAAIIGAAKGLLFAHSTVFDSDGTQLVGPPGSPSRFLPAELTPAQRWALATTAIVVRYFEEDCELLGGVMPGPEGKERCVDELADPWGISKRGEVIDMLKHLAKPEKEKNFAMLSALVAAGVATVSDSVSGEDIAFIQTNAATLGPRGLLADDLCRLVHLAGISYVAGLVSEAEAWNWILPAAIRLQQAYGSWQEMGHHYLLGIMYRRGWDEELAQSYRELCADPGSAWNRIPWGMPLQ